MTLDASLVRSEPGPVRLLHGVGPTLARLRNRPVLATLLVAGLLHLLWWVFLANTGGDIAAQDAWAGFARAHPGSAYNLSWYGGMHPVSYSVLSPYFMAVFGVRPTMVLAGTLSAGLVARLLVHSSVVRRPLWPSLYGAVALTGNAVSGRVTFALGTLFGLAALTVVFAWPARFERDGSRARWVRGASAAVLALLATAASPVAGLFLGLVAAALWLDGRRPAAYAIGLPPVLVVALSALLFPFSGQEPMHWNSAICPVVMGAAAFLLAPKGWRIVRLAGVVYVVAVLASWLLPTPIGTNITRMGLLFGGVLLVALATSSRHVRSVIGRRFGAVVATGLLGAALLTSNVWQVATATEDAINQRPPASWTHTIAPLVRQLRARDAALGRVEVVPTRSHRESSALAPYVNLARGWNRQADRSRNPMFYKPALSPMDYRRWLHRWAVRYVVMSTAAPDPSGSTTEKALVTAGTPYLRQVWSDADWTLYQVKDPVPLVSAPAIVTHFGPVQVTVAMPAAGSVVIRIPDSPWLSLVDADGNPLTSPDGPSGADAGTGLSTGLSTGAAPADCLTDLQTELGVDYRREDWVVLHATGPGVYRIAAPYKLPRGTACVDQS